MKQTTDWLNEALSQRTRVEYPWRESEPLDVMSGDIVVVGDMDLSLPNRMIMVLSTEPERRCFFGALVTNELSLATADALILESEDTDLPYKIAVQAGTAGYFWFVQIEKRLGAVNAKILHVIIDVYAGGDNEFQYNRRGMPLQYEEWDLRWADLRDEVQIIRELERDCVENRENDYIDLPYIDPRLLDDLARVEVLVEKYDELVTKSRGFSPSCIEQLLGSVNGSLLRAYPALFSPKNSILGLISKRVANETQEEWLLRCTKEDGLATAPFVKIIRNGVPGYERLRYGGKRVEYLYETVGG